MDEDRENRNARYDFWKSQGLSTRAANCLANYGYSSRSSLYSMTMWELVSMKEMGKVTRAELLKYLNMY